MKKPLLPLLSISPSPSSSPSLLLSFSPILLLSFSPSSSPPLLLSFPFFFCFSPPLLLSSSPSLLLSFSPPLLPLLLLLLSSSQTVSTESTAKERKTLKRSPLGMCMCMCMCISRNGTLVISCSIRPSWFEPQIGLRPVARVKGSPSLFPFSTSSLFFFLPSFSFSLFSLATPSLLLSFSFSRGKTWGKRNKEKARR